MRKDSWKIGQREFFPGQQAMANDSDFGWVEVDIVGQSKVPNEVMVNRGCGDVSFPISALEEHKPER